jgi:hypothetical protein
MNHLQITLKIAAANRPAAVEVYQRFRGPFLASVGGALSKELLIRDEDVQVLIGFAESGQADAYLRSEMFSVDVTAALGPLLDSPPEVRIYDVL